MKTFFGIQRTHHQYSRDQKAFGLLFFTISQVLTLSFFRLKKQKNEKKEKR